MAKVTTRLGSMLLSLAMVGCGGANPPTQDAGDLNASDVEDADASEFDAKNLACRSGVDCLATQRCVFPLETPTLGSCVRGRVPTETVCVSQCQGYCVVGPHELLNPGDPPGIVSGLTTPDCFDAGPGD